MTSINVYSKEQIDTKVPPTTGASVGDVLTVGSSGVEWATPSGGSEWEELDKTNLPTDFKAYDEIAAIISFDVATNGTTSSWTTSPATPTVSAPSNTNINSKQYFVRFIIPYYNDGQAYIGNASYSYQKYIAYLTSITATALNQGRLGYLEIQSFNGGGMNSTGTNLTINSNFVVKLWRKKTN